MATTTNKAKKSYKVRNWGKYNDSLVQRGSVTFWFSDEVVASWTHDNTESKVGRPFVYSDRAIETCLVLREMFQLPYRQTEGFARSLAQLMNADISIPDYTSLAKRAGSLAIDLGVTTHNGGSIDVVVDSTGLKVYGEGEWKMRTHGKSKRRTWRKLHLAVNPHTQEIEAEVLTENSVTDADATLDLLDHVSQPLGTFTGDGAYDQWKVYDALSDRDAQPVIPPRRNAKILQHGNASSPPLARDEALRGIRRAGRKGWKVEVGYHVRSLAETAMYRMKTIFGGALKNRQLHNQATESRIRCRILNYFTTLGMPAFEWS